MKRTLVLDVVGLTPSLIGPHTPHLEALSRRGGLRPVTGMTPAVTCSVQATYLTGLQPSEHGIVGNGWYFRDDAEVRFWRQSNNLVRGEKIWEAARRLDPSFTCAKLFWWFNMYASVDFAVTPRPMYPADGRKLPDIHTHPSTLRDDLQRRLGTFPLFEFWGPKTSIRASEWIAAATAIVHREHRPTLQLCYLPHLDYDFQRYGPHDPRSRRSLEEVDRLCGTLIDMAQADGTRVVVLSEYGIAPVAGAVHLNRTLRRAGLVAIREEMGRELLDAGASAAFAVADHQIAHVYVRDRERLDEVRCLLEAVEGVDAVWGEEEKRVHGLAHPRAGELVAVSARDRWFSYYYWFDDDRAPDFARTVDIHRKPGYDPVELFLDPDQWAMGLRIGAKLAARKLGARALLDVIPLDCDLVGGSHGRIPDDPNHGAMLLSSDPDLMPEGPVGPTAVKGLLLDHLCK